jgi:hypothetical protein
VIVPESPEVPPPAAELPDALVAPDVALVVLELLLLLPHAATTTMVAAASAVMATARVLLIDIPPCGTTVDFGRPAQPDRTRARADITQRQIPRLYERTVRRDGEPGES